jgi:hypothetical protein
MDDFHVVDVCDYVMRKKVRRLERLSNKFQKLPAEFRRHCQEERSSFEASAATRLREPCSVTGYGSGDWSSRPGNTHGEALT